MSNIDDKTRGWQNALDGGSAESLRRALGEAIQQIRQQAAGETPAPEPPAEAQPDLTAAHYLEVCAKIDAIRGSVEASERAGRKRMDLTVLRELLGSKADG